MGGSHLLMIEPSSSCNTQLPTVSLVDGPLNARAVHKAIQAGLVTSAHDCSEGGVLLAVAEMAFGGELGVELQLDDESLCFSETPSRYILEVQQDKLNQLQQLLGDIHYEVIGTFNESNNVTLGESTWAIEDLRQAWTEGMVI
jgi:phosphoribosylformylglycinamidine synthase